ncbi:glycosyl hydrolase family 95 catalytic domain-containing protein [Aestuariibaculum sediminum]|uniref:Glycosyl hydrolase family 95 N-terminal domain-containing protein n=1 Tax=Aestuariibaculum sediminum TaxID=2770637 RepID=A0A8J6UBY1_9FLAO|nr:hypothetical protein [Aestuariibaculum sediminum]MBD0831629.1 hypothetical protein [Aestuariibaculum sediminum]
MKLKNVIALVIGVISIVSCEKKDDVLSFSKHDLVFDSIPKVWDEGMPLGNAFIGALIWQKDNNLRMSLDRVDLWDMRPMENIQSDKFSFNWVYDKVLEQNYKPVQDAFDAPYDQNPAPSKLPGAALEFNLAKMGNVSQIGLQLNNAVCHVIWENGAHLETFVHAKENVGWFVVTGADDSFIPELVPPVYEKSEGKDDGPVAGLSLSRLGYTQGPVTKTQNKIVYDQKGWGDFYYQTAVKWKREDEKLIGVWAITSSMESEKAEDIVDDALTSSINNAKTEHTEWWKDYWSLSSINIPDDLLEKQYYNEMYKFGSATRYNSYPISLQAVWTADNGKLPPWKGDYHHDLNTQLSYWPAYTSNRLEQGMGYLNTLWNQRAIHKSYTKKFYGTSGLNVPGVTTLIGEPMGGWIQYAFSPTVSAWLGHHFYMQWKYSMDRTFLKEKAYPYLKDVATHLEEFSIVKNGIRTLPLSSSPEIYDNSINAWFKDITNYDLGCVSFAFKAASEMAKELGLKEEAKHWETLRKELPAYDLDETGALTFAKGHPYNISHRHFSNVMAIHPFGNLDWSDGEASQKIIKATIDKLEKVGPDFWTGYSYSWFGNIRARALDGEGAARYLRDFASSFCLKNTFHVNGDQSKTGKSKFLYRPFTLEGNFAFAAGIQEMLIQSHTGIINIFPAIPKSWKDVSFNDLRTFGAFLISAEKINGTVVSVKIKSEKGGELKLYNPFNNDSFKVNGAEYDIKNDIIIIETIEGQEIELTQS